MSEVAHPEEVSLYWEILPDGNLKIALSTPVETLANFASPGELMQGFLNVLHHGVGLDVSETESLRTRFSVDTGRAVIVWVGPGPKRIDEEIIAIQITTAAERTGIVVHGG